MAYPTFVAASSNNCGDTGTSTADVDLPAGIQDGDKIIVFLALASSSSAVQIRTPLDSGFGVAEGWKSFDFAGLPDVQLTVWIKTAVAADSSANKSWTLYDDGGPSPVDCAWCIGAAVFRDCDYIGIGTGAGYEIASYDTDAPSTDVAYDESLLLCVYGYDAANNITSISSDGQTEIIADYSSTALGAAGIMAAYEQQASAGASPVRTANADYNPTMRVARSLDIGNVSGGGGGGINYRQLVTATMGV